MRKLMLSLTALAGIAAVTGVAKAAPSAGPVAVAGQPDLVQNVAYYRGYWHGGRYYGHHHAVYYPRHYPYHHGYRYYR